MHVIESTRRRTAAGVVALASALVLSACGGTGGVDSRTAAEVGDARVSRAAVVDAVARGLAIGKTTLSKQQLTDSHLSRQVKLVLYRDEARKLGVVLTDEDRKVMRATIEEQEAGNGGLDKSAEAAGIAKADLPDVLEMFTFERVLAARLIKDHPVTDAELDALKATNPDAFTDQGHAAHILVADEATAKKVLAEVKAGGDFAALAAKYSTDTSTKDQGGDLGTQPRGKYVPAFDDALFNAKKGDIVGPVKTEFGYHIIKVIDLVKYADVKEQVRERAGSVVGPARLRAEVNAGPVVTLNPRFGRWDKAQLAVVSDAPGADDPSSPSPAPSGLVDSGAVASPEPATSSSAQ